MAKKTPDKAFFSPVKGKATGLRIGRNARTGEFQTVRSGGAVQGKAVKISGSDPLPNSTKTYVARGQKLNPGAVRAAVAQEFKTEAPVEIVATHPPVHPGEILREEFMEPMGLTAYAISKACKIPRSKLERIAREDLGISGDTAVRLGRFFGNSAQFWMNLQATYEVLKAGQEIGDALNEIEPFKQVDKSASR